MINIQVKCEKYDESKTKQKSIKYSSENFNQINIIITYFQRNKMKVILVTINNNIDNNRC